MNDDEIATAQARWVGRLNRNMRDPDYREAWRAEQCFSCAFYLPLQDSRLVEDWGACANGDSPLDGTVRFEHDGCEHHVVSVAYID